MDLKPCPFCGGKPYFDHDDAGWTWIECDQCHVATNQRISAMEDCKPLLAEDWNRRTIPPDPRTCEACDQVFDWIKKNTGWSICDPDTGYVDRDGETYRQLFDIVNRKPRSPQSADVETARSKIVLAIKFGLPIDARMALRDALAALDRIVGKEE